MLREVVELLRLRTGGTYMDATVGGGGHAEEILKHIGPKGRLIGMDRDAEALKAVKRRIKDKRLVLVKAKFSEIEEVAKDAGIEQAYGVLFDFGVSMPQLTGPERGFSFLSGGPLDMRMDRDEPLSAEEIVNEYPEKELARIIYEYGEEGRSRKIARFIAAKRRGHRISTCLELADLVASAVGGRRGRLHPATKTFQALRIAVNDELGEIKRGLESVLKVLAPGGRLVAIAYHSLEDRVVKTFMKESRQGGLLRVLTKKPLRPSREETIKNPSARSARLRAGEAI
jgi:16S rRNA (cytosine1402-N4)-methyltransferase